MRQWLPNKPSVFFDAMLLLLFLTLIFGPPMKTWFTPRTALSSSEKRSLAQLPHLDLSLNSWQSFPARFESYLNDHLGFRDQWIKSYNFIKVFWLQKSPVKKVLLGKNGWLYYTEVQSIEDYRGLLRPSPEDLLRERLILENRRTWLAAQGIRYLVAVAPNKQSIYPEFLPDTLTRVDPRTQMDRFQSYMATHSDLRILDLRPIFLEKKREALLYHPTDTHWNPRGRLLAYQQIIQRLQDWFPELKGLAPDDFYQADIQVWGDLAWMLNLHEYYPAIRHEVEVKNPCAERQEAGVDLARFQAMNTAIPPEYIVIAAGCRQAKRRALVFRDSFFAHLDTYLAESFAQVVYFWLTADMKLFEELVTTYHPDLVVEERSERLFLVNLWTESRGTDALLQAQFERMGKPLFRYQGGDLPGLEAAGEVLTTATEAGLRLHCRGGDPQLILPTPELAQGSKAILKVLIDCPQDSVLQLFFQNGEGPATYNEEQSMIRTVRKGPNELYLPLTENAAGTIRARLRLDPGYSPGDYLLRAVELRTGPEAEPPSFAAASGR